MGYLRATKPRGDGKLSDEQWRALVYVVQANRSWRFKERPSHGRTVPCAATTASNRGNLHDSRAMSEAEGRSKFGARYVSASARAEAQFYLYVPGGAALQRD